MAELPEPYGGRSREEYEQLLLAKLQPAAIRSTLSFAGLYQMTHEMLKQAILHRVRDFSCTGVNENGFTFDEISYQGNVIDAARSEGWIKNNKQVLLPQRYGLSGWMPSQQRKLNDYRTFMAVSAGRKVC